MLIPEKYTVAATLLPIAISLPRINLYTCTAVNCSGAFMTDEIRWPIDSKSIRFMDRFRLFMRARHLAYKTEKTYCYWVHFYIRFHKKRNPRPMAGIEIEQFLEFLSTDRSVAASTKEAFNALVFLHEKFLGRNYAIVLPRIATVKRT